MASARTGLRLILAGILATGQASATLGVEAVGVEPPFRVRTSGRAVAASLRQALAGAAERLRAPVCAAIFEDFTDGGGRTLQANLDALGETGTGYLRLIGFYDGTGQAGCLKESILAITTQGSRVVWVCPRFALEQHRDPGLAEAVLIHEALHSLGLGENPPSAAEITGKVVERCGR